MSVEVVGSADVSPFHPLLSSSLSLSSSLYLSLPLSLSLSSSLSLSNLSLFPLSSLSPLSLLPLCAITDAVAVGNSAYGPGEGRVLLQTVRCNGSESALLNCPFTSPSIFSFRCFRHIFDASVVCQGKYLYSGTLRWVHNTSHCPVVPCLVGKRRGKKKGKKTKRHIVNIALHAYKLFHSHRVVN